MSKSEHLSLLVSVVGLSGCGPDVYKGPGKSSLCFNLLHPTEYLKEHSSTLSLQQFESRVIDKQHYVYWGTKTEYYYKLPKSKKSTGEKILVTVNFQIFEQTEFIEDITKKPFAAKHEYAERAMKLPHSSNRLSFKTVPLVLMPEKYNAVVSPSTKSMKNGYIFAIDVSKGCPTFSHQLILLKRMVKPHKKMFVIAATKYDQVDPKCFEEVKIAGQALNVEVIPTSIEMEDGRWGTEVFKYLAIKLFNLQSEDAYGVAGDSYLRYATEPPPSKAPVKKAEQMPKSKSVEERPSTPPIPPRNYRLGSMPHSPPSSLDDSGYGNFIRQNMDQTSIDGGFSMPDPAMTETHTTEIPPAIVARKSKTLDKRFKLASLNPVDSQVVNKPTTVGSFSEDSSIPPLPPKPKSSYAPSRKLSIPSPPKSPILKPKKSPVSQPSQPMATRPLPKLPFISDDDDDTNQISMRCDYDKIDYTKMRHLRNLTKNTERQKVKQKLSKAKLSIPNPAVPERNIPRRKETPTESPQAKHKPPPVAKKPTVKPRRRSVNANDLVKQESLTSHTKTQDHHGGACSLDYEDTVAVQDVEYDDTGYVNEGENLKPALSTNQPKYPPRCIPRKYYFLNGRRALPVS